MPRTRYTEGHIDQLNLSTDLQGYEKPPFPPKSVMKYGYHKKSQNSVVLPPDINLLEDSFNMGHHAHFSYDVTPIK